ncbi:glycosyltransferase family 2 protein [Streptococcus caprae]|uniref:Glycosyltransferase family 2 protein n=1 Tax=Streptococcus caprae TaxID=1640501 RepID=A0ABV8CTV5_9STRE
MTLLTVAIPSYNASEYLHYCVESLALAGDQLEILIINDGSADKTQEIAESLQAKYPGIVRAIYQDNMGHGGAVNTGMREAKGTYFKVVDSDDWVDTRALLKILETLESFVEPVDAFITNFVYEKEGKSRKAVMRYDEILPEDRIFTWDEVGSFGKGQYMMMHSLIYRTQLLKDIALELPTHTFYVDNIFVFEPLKYVQTMYYLPVDFYRYLIGREEQSVNETVMISRIDQQIKVNKILIDSFDMDAIANERCRDYLLNHVEITTIISSALLNRAGQAEHIAKKKELWEYLKTHNPELYKKVRRGMLGQIINLYGYPGRKVSNAAYRIARRIYGFN